MTKKTIIDYFYGLGDGDELLDIYEHLEELKNHIPRCLRGEKKKKFYEDKLNKKWKIQLPKR